MVEYCCLLAFFSWFAFFCTQEQLTWGATTPSGLGLSTLIINKENVPQICLRTAWWRQAFNESSLFQDDSRFASSWQKQLGHERVFMCICVYTCVCVYMYICIFKTGSHVYDYFWTWTSYWTWCLSFQLDWLSIPLPQGWGCRHYLPHWAFKWGVRISTWVLMLEPQDILSVEPFI